eukprot:TRINITY_DN12729_c0_g1_i1.p2 TRINITY_DN12729_c0_g1~~TRINITY_DN12729_c0_g1_i1.p2  ORF type:complete len:167 (+),score=5.57 TRINITY_DN12729_c0_g1_i1:145-645(+)
MACISIFNHLYVCLPNEELASDQFNKDDLALWLQSRVQFDHASETFHVQCNQNYKIPCRLHQLYHEFHHLAAVPDLTVVSLLTAMFRSRRTVVSLTPKHRYPGSSLRWLAHKLPDLLSAAKRQDTIVQDVTDKEQLEYLCQHLLPYTGSISFGWMFPINSSHYRRY